MHTGIPIIVFNTVYLLLLLTSIPGIMAMLSGLPSFYYLPPICPCSHSTCSPNEEPLMENGELERARFVVLCEFESVEGVFMVFFCKMKIDYVERSVYGFFGELKFEGVFFCKSKI
jgi:hypothetical protein